MNKIIPDFPPPRPEDQEKQLYWVQAGCAFIVIFLAAGIWLQLPYLTEESARLEAWKIIGLWSADILAIVWFVRFTVDHAILCEPLTAIPFENGKQQVKLVAIAGLTAITLDLALTSYFIQAEHAGYSRGILAEAQVMAVHETKRELETWYEADCRYTDASGVSHKVRLRVEADRHAFPKTLPAETKITLLSHGHNGHSMRIRYDPEFPARAWVDGAGWDDGRRIYWFSLLTLFFQAIVTALFLLLLAKRSSTNYLPWWWDIYKVLPLFVGAFWLFTMGLVDRLMDSLE